MSKHKRIAELINKFRKDELNEEEERELNIWIRSSEDNHRIFDRIAEKKHLQEERDYMASLEVKREWEKIDDAYTKKYFFPPKRARILRYQLVAACIFILFTGIAFITLWLDTGKKQKVAEVAEPALVDEGIASKKVLLTLDDGREITLDSNINKQNIRQGKFRLVYENGMLKYLPLAFYSLKHEISYNSLSTLHGVQCQVQLPDGSRVCLNAGSGIRYPLSFEGDVRKVAINGEVYFDVVTIKAANVKKKFIVEVAVPSKKKMMVEVLGTRFNINAYDDEPVIRTTLVEGHVKVYSAADNVSIEPGQQAVMQKSGKVTVNNADVFEVIGWTNDTLSFKDMPLKNVMKEVGRWYGFQILYADDITDSVTLHIPTYLGVRSALDIIELTTAIRCVIVNNMIIVSNGLRRIKVHH